MSDQADGLRQLVRSRSPARPNSPGAPSAPRTPPPPRCRSVILTSGKGGVGTSNLALNLAVALGAMGRRVVLVDADLGLANIDLLCDLRPPHDLGDVLAGTCTLAEAVVAGPGGIRVVAGFHAARALAVPLTATAAANRLIPALAELKATADVLLVDAGSGLGPAITTLAASSDEVILVTTPEPTALADGHALIGRLRRLSGAPALRAVVTQAASRREGAEILARLAALSRQFQGAIIDGLGTVRLDPAVALAVRRQTPLAVSHPSSPAARDIRRLAAALIARSEPTISPRKPGLLATLAARWRLAQAASL